MAEHPLGMSTSWNAAGLRDGHEIVRQIADLGFRCLEVEYRVSAEAAAGIEAAVRDGTVRVLSVHNYTPLAPDERATSRGGDKGNLASPDEAVRKDAVKLTLRSLDLGRRLGAEALVLHLGETAISGEYFRHLVDTVEKEGVASEQAERVRLRVRERRDAIRGQHLEAALRSLEDLLPRAEAAGIVLGIENRFYFHQVPLAEEIPEILDRMESPFVRYWHDIGHAHVMEVLGFTGPESLPAALPERAFGVHIHDALFIRDHKAPGSGEIRLASVLKRIPEDALRIVEVSDRVPREDIVAGLDVLKDLSITA